jgi:hypothetical protein
MKDEITISGKKSWNKSKFEALLKKKIAEGIKKIERKMETSIIEKNLDFLKDKYIAPMVEEVVKKFPHSKQIFEDLSIEKNGKASIVIKPVNVAEAKRREFGSITKKPIPVFKSIRSKFEK